MNDALSLAVWSWHSSSPAAESLVEQLVQASVAGLVLGAAVWIAVRLTPGLSAGLRCVLWWAVSLKLLVTVVGFAVLEVALLPPSSGMTSAPATEAQAPISRPGMGAISWPEPAASPMPGPNATRTDPTAARDGAVEAGTAPLPLAWTDLVALLWLLGVGVGLAGIGRELIAARHLRRESRPVENAHIRDRFAALKARFGIHGEVALHVSERIRVPLTLGWLRPLVIVPPSTLSQLDERELSMALGHELIHVRRLDLWSAWIPRLARCVFFFHPVAVIAAREYALAREAACDAAVVRELEVAPCDYGRLLIRWRPSLPRHHALEGVGCAAASASFAQLKRRLEMLELPTAAPRRLGPAHCLMALVLLAAALPVRIIAQPPEPPEPPAAPQAFFSRGETGTFERTIEVEEPLELDVQTGSGGVTVRSGSGDQVGIAGRIVVRTDRSRTREEAAELVRHLEANPPIEVSGGVVRIGHDLNRDDQRNVSISYNIVVPQATVVRSRTGSGGQEIDGVAGPVEAQTGSGSIRLNDIGSSASVQTGSGSIRADRIAGGFTARTGSGSVTLTQTAAGDVEVTTGSGSSTLHGVQGALRARAGSGAITVEGDPTGPWDLQTGSGSIALRLPADVGFELDAQTGSGRIQTDHPVLLQGTVARNRLSGAVRGGGPLIRARTGSGGVRIE
jgi:beta-lactamase regulating signal transducer with metallopeptidase domain